jgi:hypothetical protein
MVAADAAFDVAPVVGALEEVSGESHLANSAWLGNSSNRLAWLA